MTGAQLISPNPTLDHRQLYRLPWSDADNVLSWLEPTAKCNLACEGCYRENVDKHKTLGEIRSDLDAFNAQRTYDSVSIAGGEPLLHPDIIDIVRMVAKDGHKPVINTNGLALTEPLLRKLKAAGLVGLTFHIDSKQSRPGWKNKNELELNELRLETAQMVRRVGGLSCAFNCTVYEDTLQYVPALVQFAQDHIDLVDVMVFILFRAAVNGGEFDFYRDGHKVSMAPMPYSVDKVNQRLDLNARELVGKIRERFPDFNPSAFLGGTEQPESLKWLFTGRFGFPARDGVPSTTLGYVGPRFMEYVQTAHHALTGRYLAYAPKGSMEAGRSALALGLIEPGVRATARKYFSNLMRRPLDLFKPLHYQSIMVIQPADIMPDGRQNMCDGCPDVTIHEGQMVWSCRLEEYSKHGGLVQCVAKGCSPTLEVKAKQPRPTASARKKPSA